MLLGILKRLLRRGASGEPGRFAQSPPALNPGHDWLVGALELQRRGAHREVIATCRSVLEGDPESIDALNLAAAGLCAQGQSREGLACLRRVVELAPESPKSHSTLAGVLASTGDSDGAFGHYRLAAQLSNAPESWHHLARSLQAFGRNDEAEECCRSGLRGSPDDAALHHTLGRVLFEQGRLDAAVTEFRVALAIDPDLSAAHSDLLRTGYYADDQDPMAAFEAHRAWAQRYARPLEEAAPPHGNDPDPARRLRIGYVSPYFSKHAVTFFFETMIEHHDRANVEVMLYADVARPDEYSARLRAYGSTWRNTVGMSDEALAQLVRQDTVDILIDLTGHTPNNRLLAFARRPAPVQMTSLTTGLASIGYRITDAYADPPGMTEHLHAEKPLRLPGLYTAWRPPDDQPEGGVLPAALSGRITFGSFNSCFKVTPTVVALWSRILRETPGSRLVLLAFNGDAAARRVRDLFSAHGIDGGRLEFMPRMTFDEYFSSRQQVDIALDTFPFHGVTTTCDSLWMGVPVVVLAGATYFSRVGVSLLANVGLPHLVARSGDEYVEIALRLAGDLSELNRMRASLRKTVLQSRVVDGRSCARHLENALRQAWVTWCQARNA